MRRNKDELGKTIINNPLFFSLSGFGGALLCADTLKNGALLCIVTTLASVCVFAFGAIISSKMNEKNCFWAKVLLGAILAIPLVLAVGSFLEAERAMLFGVVTMGLCIVFSSNDSKTTVVDAVGSSLTFSLGYSVAVIIYAFVRELLACGSILGKHLFDGIELFKTWYGAIFLFVIVAVLYKLLVDILTKARDKE